MPDCRTGARKNGNGCMRKKMRLMLERWKAYKAFYKSRGLTKETASFDVMDEMDDSDTIFLVWLMENSMEVPASEKDAEERIRFLRELISMFPDTEIEMDLFYAELIILTGSYVGEEEALALFRQANEIFPRSGMIWGSLYHAIDSQKAEKMAKEELERAEKDGILTDYLESYKDYWCRSQVGKST